MNTIQMHSPHFRRTRLNTSPIVTMNGTYSKLFYLVETGLSEMLNFES